MTGKKLHNFARDLWKFNRSLTGEGVRQTLKQIKNYLPTLKVYEVPSGTAVYDWKVPEEWNVFEAYIVTPEGKKICDFSQNNLHLVGYSIPFEKKLSLDELKKHLYSDKDLPESIPFVTSYYKKIWGFCISHRMLKKLIPGTYEVVIRSELKQGSMTYAELLIEGKSKKEVLISTYICHPSMANNELSGPVVSTFLASWLIDNKKTQYSYRFIFIPETIGSIFYINKNINSLKSNVKIAFNLSCIGDNRNYSYLPSKQGNTMSDRIAKHVLGFIDKKYKEYTWNDRGSDERQFCSPGVDIPMVTLSRTKFGEYKEYHTSFDDLERVVTPDGLEGGFNLIKKCIIAIENNVYVKTLILCEPNLGQRGLYPTLSIKNGSELTKNILNILTYGDGKTSLLDIAEKSNLPIWELFKEVKVLEKEKLIKCSFNEM